MNNRQVISHKARKPQEGNDAIHAQGKGRVSVHGNQVVDGNLPVF